MKKFKMKEYSFNDVKPISLDEIKGGTAAACCTTNSGCNENTSSCCVTNGGCNKNFCGCNKANQIQPPCGEENVPKNP